MGATRAGVEATRAGVGATRVGVGATRAGATRAGAAGPGLEAVSRPGPGLRPRTDSPRPWSERPRSRSRLFWFRSGSARCCVRESLGPWPLRASTTVFSKSSPKSGDLPAQASPPPPAKRSRAARVGIMAEGREKLVDGFLIGNSPFPGSGIGRTGCGSAGCGHPPCLLGRNPGGNGYREGEGAGNSGLLERLPEDGSGTRSFVSFRFFREAGRSWFNR